LTGTDGIAKAIREKPDFVLLDLVISDMGGLEVLAKLKANDKTKKIPLALLTNLTKKELAQEAIGLGVIDFWPKTEVLPSEIVRRIKAILKIE
jgi:CheY-like chemotaxis protein